ncbi:hypothetical protein [Brachybacterium saurashtrense]|uniref:Dehydrogenase n=1 Tax=Brachybacterium saurashtrense TaxID=556288 RepID=A0A345YJV2_9MICO|nr:hypothetical protein [Brachybacterium saurashtrense]AXK44204.1 hypothetical protein DWV08_00225 [Brachybacterium saurashtrense]RRR21476.1 hypothetical protein DXU92_14125 [Brachybacterium saurashtrense]
MSTLNIHAAPGAIGADAVLASLPVSFTAASTERDAQVQVLDGAPGWLGHATTALDAGQTVLVQSPAPLEAEEQERARVLAEDPAGSRLLLDLPWAGNPALEAAGPAVRTAAEGAGLLEVHALLGPVARSGTALLDVALTVAALLGPLERARLLHADEGGATVLAGAAGRDVSIQLTPTLRPTHGCRMRVLGATSTAEVTLPDSGTARPAEVTLTDATGHTVLPTLWESSHRAAWRRVHRLDADDAVDDIERLLHAHTVLADVLAALPR